MHAARLFTAAIALVVSAAVPSSALLSCVVDASASSSAQMACCHTAMPECPRSAAVQCCNTNHRADLQVVAKAPAAFHLVKLALALSQLPNGIAVVLAREVAPTGPPVTLFAGTTSPPHLVFSTLLI